MGGRRIGLVIGTNEYSYSGLSNLEFAINDANNMISVLSDRDLCYFDEVVDLRDKSSNDVSLEIEKVLISAKSSDLILIYFSGHGTQDFENELCLCFKNTNFESKLTTSLNFAFINKCRRQSPCQSVVIILDCCYSFAAGIRGDSLEVTLSEYSGSGTVILSSTGSVACPLAKEEMDLKHGIFTYYLLDGLRSGTADEDNDGFISVEELYHYAWKNTKDRTSQSQIPKMVGEFSEKIIIAKNLRKIKEEEFERIKRKLFGISEKGLPAKFYDEAMVILSNEHEDPKKLTDCDIKIKSYLNSLLDGEMSIQTYVYTIQCLKNEGNELAQAAKQETKSSQQKVLPKKPGSSSGNRILVFSLIFIFGILLMGAAAIFLEQISKPSPPTIESFGASSNEIVSGDRTTLTWSVSGATSVTITPEIGDVSSSGLRAVSPTQTTTYNLTATNEDGSKQNTVVVLVEPPEEDPKPSQDLPNISVNTYTNYIGMKLVLIPAGEFMMGSPSDEVGRCDDEGPVHKVKIEGSYYLGKYEVTQKQWREVMGNNPSYFEGDDLPVEEVSWNDVQDFIKKLNEKEGTDKYRLPSEAEWEYACRAGTTTRYYFGDSESKLGDYAWYDDNSGSKTHPVGQKKPNPWGLYDMHGNVYEWCQDRWHDGYDGAPSDGSAWESGSSSFRVFRGGYWIGSARGCRSAFCGCNDPDFRGECVGFRVLRNM